MATSGRQCHNSHWFILAKLASSTGGSSSRSSRRSSERLAVEYGWTWAARRRAGIVQHRQNRAACIWPLLQVVMLKPKYVSDPVLTGPRKEDWRYEAEVQQRVRPRLHKLVALVTNELSLRQGARLLSFAYVRLLSLSWQLLNVVLTYMLWAPISSNR